MGGGLRSESMVRRGAQHCDQEYLWAQTAIYLQSGISYLLMGCHDMLAWLFGGPWGVLHPLHSPQPCRMDEGNSPVSSSTLVLTAKASRIKWSSGCTPEIGEHALQDAARLLANMCWAAELDR